MVHELSKNKSGVSFKLKKTYLYPYYIARKSLFNTIKENTRYAHGILLDVGCGEKPYYGLFSGKMQTYIGLDLPSSSSGSADVFADALHLPLRTNSVDTVLSTEVIEHVPEPRTLLDEINRVLRDKGILILSAPLVWGLHSEPHDFFRFTKYGLEYLMVKTNFRMLKCQQTCGFWATQGQRLNDFLFQRCSKSRGGMVLLVPFCAFVQFFSTVLDKAFSHQGDTLDYVVIASKK